METLFMHFTGHKESHGTLCVDGGRDLDIYISIIRDCFCDIRSKTTGKYLPNLRAEARGRGLQKSLQIRRSKSWKTPNSGEGEPLQMWWQFRDWNKPVKIKNVHRDSSWNEEEARSCRVTSLSGNSVHLCFINILEISLPFCANP